jgi:hypothetical protein
VESLAVEVKLYCTPCMSLSKSDPIKEWYDEEFDVLPYRTAMKLKRAHDKECSQCVRP